ncbi:MAG: hypothetical protein LC777_00935 [Actinobacteria bacterium]|nr:hypothetical protein [Actinomycetota bacterium]
MSAAPPGARSPGYRVVVYELNRDRQTKVMDATAAGFIAAAASIDNGQMDIALADGGPHGLQQHLALFIANHYAPDPPRSDAGG